MAPPDSAPSPTPAKVGRPTVLTVALIDRIVASVRAGNFLETAAKANGANIHLVRDWLFIGARLDRGETPHPTRPVSPELGDLCLQFAQRLQEADAQREQADVARLVKHGKKDWMAHMSRMERRWPRRWARPPQRIEHSGPDGGPIESRKLVIPWPGRAGLSEPSPDAQPLPPLALPGPAESEPADAI